MLQYKSFLFNKTEKSPQIIEKRLNEYLEQYNMSIATQAESATEGKFLVSLFFKPGKSNLRAKVFRESKRTSIQASIEEFINNHKLKYVTQSFGTSSVFTVIYYEVKEDNNSGEEKKQD